LGIEKFLVDQRVEDFKIKVKDEEFILKVKPLSWGMRNKALSEAIKIDKDGQYKIDLDGYAKYILCARIVEAPWGQTSFSFLNNLNPEIGDQLNSLIPSIWGVEKKAEEGELLKNALKE